MTMGSWGVERSPERDAPCPRSQKRESIPTIPTARTYWVFSMSDEGGGWRTWEKTRVIQLTEDNCCGGVARFCWPSPSWRS